VRGSGRGACRQVRPGIIAKIEGPAPEGAADRVGGKVMANIKSALKRARKARELKVRNASVRTGFKTLIRAFNETLDVDPTEAEKLYPTVAAALDQAARKGVIHPNSAARRKSRLARDLRARLTKAAAAARSSPTGTA
jgi:small subunit ribosomal protein S20